VRAVILTLLATAFAVWYCVQRSRVTRAREYSNAAMERWEEEGGRSPSPAGVRDDQAMLS
jgi:hypothetical protein